MFWMCYNPFLTSKIFNFQRVNKHFYFKGTILRLDKLWLYFTSNDGEDIKGDKIKGEGIKVFF